MADENTFTLDEALRTKVHDISEILVRQQFGGLEGNVSLPLNKVNTIKTPEGYYDTCVFADVLGTFTSLPKGTSTSWLHIRDKSMDELVGDLYLGSEIILVVRKNTDSLYEGHSYHFDINGNLLAYQEVALNDTNNSTTWQPVRYLGEVPDNMKPQVYRLLDESLDRVSANYKLVKGIDALNARQVETDKEIETIKREIDAVNNDFHKSVGVSTDVPYHAPNDTSTMGKVGTVGAVGVCLALLGYAALKLYNKHKSSAKK